MSVSAIAKYISGIFNYNFLIVTVVSVILGRRIYRGWRRSRDHDNNPFSSTFVLPPSPLVTDKAIRKSVLKQKFTADKVPENLDAIIIGSGIGGLSVAVLLSRVGKRVLVLEQHDQAGGCCHSFKDKGFEFDTGIHYIGRMTEGSFWRVLVDQVCSGQIVWAPMDEAYDRVAIGDTANPRWYDIKFPREKFIDALAEHFPDERQAIEKVVDMTEDAEKSYSQTFVIKFIPKWICKGLYNTGILRLMFPKYFKYNSLLLQDVLVSVTDNQELRAVLSYIFGDYGLTPKNSPFLMHALMLRHFGSSGAFYPRGGSSEIAFSIIPNIEKAGGKVLVKASVSNILIDSSGRANGVRVHGKTETIDIYARYIISGAGVANTFCRLLPPEVAQKSSLYPLQKKVGVSVPSFTVFMGLRGTKEELGLSACNSWVFSSNDFDKLIEDTFATPAENACNAEALMFISFPSAKDPSWNERFPGKSVGLIITFVPYHWFEKWEKERVKKRGQEYDDFKTVLGQHLWKKCVQLFPKLQDKLEFFDTGTPLSNNYYMGVQKGEVYGMDHNLDRFKPGTIMQLRPDTDIPGLYLTGQDVAAVGFVGALSGGVLCASKILKRNLFADLSALRKQLKKSE